MGASSSKSSSKPKDMTPGAFKDLQQPFADVIGNLVGQFIPNATTNIMQGYKGPLTTPVTGGEQNILTALQQQQQGYQSQAPGMAPQPAPGGQPPVDTSAGPTPSTPAQPAPQDPGLSNLLGNVVNQSPAPTGPAGPSQASQNLMNQTAQTGSAGGVQDFVNQLGLGPSQSLGQFQQGLASASQTGAFGGQPNNPFAQAYIDQAQRQTMQNLEETLSRTLPGRFTQAGHITQPGGSSAFDRAAAIATRGATQEMGDIATRISYQDMAAAQEREAAALGQELGRRGEGDARIAQAQQNQLDRALQIPGLEGQLQNLSANTQNTLAGLPTRAAETALTYAQAQNAGANTGLTQAQTGLTQAQTGTQKAQTGLTGAQIQGQEVDNLLKNLQGQALPRLIQDLGIERGTEAFNNNINSLLSVLGIGAGVTRPVISSESKSSSGGVQLK